MNKKHFKYILKSIKKDLTRLIAICLIVFLGVGFLVGLMSSPKDLRASINSYYLNSNLLDVYIQSTIGFDQDDVEFLENNIDEIDKIQSYNQLDQYVYLDDTKVQGRVIYRTFNVDDIDKLTLVEGEYPDEKNECVLLEAKDSMSDYTLDSEVIIDNETYKVVGKVKDPFYIANQPEQTIIGNGILDTVIYLNSTLYEPKDVTMLKITFTEARKFNTFSEDYKKLINIKSDEIIALSSERLEKRKETLKQTIIKEVEVQMAEEIKKQIVEIAPSLADSTLLEDIMNYVVTTDMFKENVSKVADEQFNKLLGSTSIKWYVLTRNEVPSFYMCKTDISKINTVANILPVFFFLIALLVSISSITRIVQKDRGEIGTLRSLGYGKGTILSKYIVYGLLSTVIGCVVGSILGTFVLPTVIMYIYTTLYDIPKFVFEFDYVTVLFFSGLMLVMILGTILIIAASNLRENVSALMIGKAPVAGKKILLERIPFIRKHISFKQKSMFRNVFRFKKNLIMIVIGIGGCTALLLTSFGLKDSIGVSQTEQYKTIIKYDLIVSVNNIEENPINKSLRSEPIYYLNGDVLAKDENIDVSILSSNKLNDYVGFTSSEPFGETSVIVTQQIADELGLNVGENIVIELDKGNGFSQFRVTGITKNYINNYVYIGEQAFKEHFEDFNKNAFLVNTGYEAEKLKTYMRELLNNENVTAISSTSDMAVIYGNILDNLTAIVVILVLLSGALIAVVIYNLTDIIVAERIKEIATLRVTGYTRRETLSYIFREIYFMSLIGVLIGLGLGVAFHRFVMVSITSLGLTFGLAINPFSYLYTLLLAFGFITITAICFYPKIKNIQMAEALKSVE